MKEGGLKGAGFQRSGFRMSEELREKRPRHPPAQAANACVGLSPGPPGEMMAWQGDGGVLIKGLTFLGLYFSKQVCT